MKYAALLLASAIVALGGCSGPAIMGTGGALIVLTRPDQPPSADMQSQIPEHESWCYRTMGDVQCYAHAQDVAPERLVNVEPQNRYPLTVRDYRDEIAGKHDLPPATAEPVALDSAAMPPVESAALPGKAGL